MTPPPAAAVADFAGNWELTLKGENMGTKRLVLEQNGVNVTGYFGYNEESGREFRGTVSGSTLTGKFYNTNPVNEWEFIVTMSAGGGSFDGYEYYSDKPWSVQGVRK